MTRTLLPRAVDAGATVIPNCRVHKMIRRGGRITEVRCHRTEKQHGGGSHDPRRPRLRVRGCNPDLALLQRSGVGAGVGSGLKVHPMIKIAERFPHPLDHGGVPMQVITEFGPNQSIGGSDRGRAQVAMALADSSADYGDALDDWEHVSVYYAAIRSEGRGRVMAGARAASAGRHVPV
jgi:hypothetical protein